MLWLLLLLSTPRFPLPLHSLDLALVIIGCKGFNRPTNSTLTSRPATRVTHRNSQTLEQGDTAQRGEQTMKQSERPLTSTKQASTPIRRNVAQPISQNIRPTTANHNIKAPYAHNKCSMSRQFHPSVAMCTSSANTPASTTSVLPKSGQGPLQWKENIAIRTQEKQNNTTHKGQNGQYNAEESREVGGKKQ